VFEEADKNKDGKLDFEEFFGLMQKKMAVKHANCNPKEGAEFMTK